MSRGVAYETCISATVAEVAIPNMPIDHAFPNPDAFFHVDTDRIEISISSDQHMAFVVSRTFTTFG